MGNDRKALCIGINNYENASDLRGSINDATSMAQVLEKHSDGSPNFSVQLLTSSEHQTTKSNIRGAIERLFSGPNINTALLYFSGHGTIKSTGGILVTSDCTRNDEGILMSEIMSYANSSKIQNKVIILDCCHSGALGNIPEFTPGLSVINEGISILTACNEDEEAVETENNALFTSLIIDALKGGAADLRGFITPGSIYSYVDQALGAWDQRPIFKTNISNFISLRNVTPPISSTKLRKIVEYFPEPEYEYKLDRSYEFTEECANEKNISIFKILQKYTSVGLVVPIGEEHMYYAAIKNKSCKLTALGYQYWSLVKKNKI